MAVVGAKWIDGITPETSVEAAALLSFAARLGAVAHFLPLAAYHAGDDLEHVHRLRVTTRRATAALELYKHFLPKKRRRRMKRSLKSIRQAAGTARDLDVLIARLQLKNAGEEQFLAELVRGRQEAQPAIIAVHESIAFESQVEELLKRVRARGPEKVLDKKGSQGGSFQAWALGQFEKVCEQFFAVEATHQSDFVELHQFRIRGKALRYTLELIEGGLPRMAREDIYPLVERVQELLGTINDHAAARERFKALRNESGDRQRRELIQNLINHEGKQLNDAMAKFHGWWNRKGRERLRSSIDELFDVAATTEEPRQRIRIQSP
jgi:CHAD domain-containing protein